MRNYRLALAGRLLKVPKCKRESKLEFGRRGAGKCTSERSRDKQRMPPNRTTMIASNSTSSLSFYEERLFPRWTTWSCIRFCSPNHENKFTVSKWRYGRENGKKTGYSNWKTEMRVRCSSRTSPSKGGTCRSETLDQGIFI